MSAFSDFLFAGGGMSPHGYCIAWDPVLLWLHVLSDLAIAISYLMIPFIILVFLRRRADPLLTPPALLFVAFISACALSHLMGIVTLWTPAYGLQGLIKAVTAIVSLVTATALIHMLPALLRIPAPSILARKLRQLEVANDEAREFERAIGHDLRSPIWGLDTTLQLLAEEEGHRLDPEGRQLLERARTLTRDLQCFADGMRDLARMDDHVDLDQTIDLGGVFRAEVAAQAGLVEESGARIDIADDMPVVRGEVEKLRVLAGHLLSNALKFRRPDKPPRIRVDAGYDGEDWVVVRIRDNGVGMRSQDTATALKLFRRLHASHRGSGLGLALCRRIATLHGGDIAITSEPGVGTIVRVRLPAASSPAPVKTRPTLAPA